MSKLLEVVKGIFIGIANIIPGVSGGTLAVSMGVYSKIIEAINQLKKDFKNSVKTLLPYGIGIVIGIAALSFVITFLFEQFEMPTISCFIGLVLGGVPLLLGKVKTEKIKGTHIFSFLVMLAVIIVPTLIAIETPAIQSMDLSFFSVLILIGLGVISAAAMVVPGISGSMILMMLGYYTFIITTIKGSIEALFHLEFATFWQGAKIMIPFAIGIVIGIIGISKIISKLFKKYPNATYWGIMGLVIASPFAIIMKSGLAITSPLSLLICLVMFAIGFAVSHLLGEK